MIKRENNIIAKYSNWQLAGLTILRVMIGWHFLYEGLIKLYTAGWTAQEYLSGSVGPLALLFKYMSQNESILKVVDILNVWGLLLIGVGLFAGLSSKGCKIAGMVLLSLYYLAYPPFAGLGGSGHLEGSYWVVNKNLIEIGALFVLYLFPTSHITGLDSFIFKRYKNKDVHLSGEANTNNM